MATLGEVVIQTIFGSSENSDMYRDQVVRPLMDNPVALQDMATQMSVRYGISVKKSKMLLRLLAKHWDTEVP